MIIINASMIEETIEKNPNVPDTEYDIGFLSEHVWLLSKTYAIIVSL
jgi:hypothetical protein